VTTSGLIRFVIWNSISCSLPKIASRRSGASVSPCGTPDKLNKVSFPTRDQYFGTCVFSVRVGDSSNYFGYTIDIIYIHHFSFPKPTSEVALLKLLLLGIAGIGIRPIVHPFGIHYDCIVDGGQFQDVLSSI